MAIATGTALGLLAAGQAGASIYGASRAAGASREAAEQQRKAAQEAIRYQEPLYQQALSIAQQQAAQGQARYAPYAQTGGQGLVALSQLLGVPAPTIPAETTVPPLVQRPATPAPPPGVQRLPVSPVNQATLSNPMIAEALNGVSIPRAEFERMRAAGMSPQDIYAAGRARQAAGPLTPAPTPGAGPGQGAGTVLLRAPNGQTQAVPAAQVDYYLARGARRV